jgi:hypothetical protein
VHELPASRELFAAYTQHRDLASDRRGPRAVEFDLDPGLDSLVAFDGVHVTCRGPRRHREEKHQHSELRAMSDYASLVCPSCSSEGLAQEVELAEEELVARARHAIEGGGGRHEPQVAPLAPANRPVPPVTWNS